METTIVGVSMGTTAVGAAAAATMSRPFKMTRIIRNNNYITTICQQQYPHLHLHLRQQNSQLKLKFGESSRIVNFGKVELGEIGRLRNSRQFQCKAINQSQEAQDVFQGVYGPWTIDSSDVREVILYRSGLVTAALSFVLASSTAFLPGDSLLSDILKQNLDLFYLLGSTGLGLSLFLIHIYVTEIKRTLQALWALGTVGSLIAFTALAQPAGEGLVQYVVDNPTAVWLVGPVFASLTGLVFKEGLCYGKLEAAVLTFIIPISLLGHLTGILDDSVKLSLLGVWMALFTVFAGRKFTQPVKDDIGDKSVFMFNALPEEEKAVLLEKLNQ